MILVDFSNLIHRILFVSVKNTSPSILEYKGMFLHMLFNNLKTIKTEFSPVYGDIVLCLDDQKSWRKDFYPAYKGDRAKKRDDSAIDFKEFYKLIDDTLEKITEFFPFKVVKASKAEGDDVIACIVKNRGNGDKCLIVTEDKDMRQLRHYPNVDIYKPINKVWDTSSMSEIDSWILEHLLVGDSIDNIPSIKKETEFSKKFIKHMQSYGIYETDVYRFFKLAISKKILEEYSEVDKKGKLDVYKPALFGEVKAREFAKDLKGNIYQNKLWIRNFVRNRKLIMFKYIPKDIEFGILESFDSAKSNYDGMKIMNYFVENKLKYLAEGAQDFFIETNSSEDLGDAKFDDWFV